ncbi:hypothetical protein BGZ63DRAFT_168089 [Mariannaea sp. PMI_226]|nr:hypothetical protein BGZ63DRAFT_168089 [Mariannaea sp. PMI_226]
MGKITPQRFQGNGPPHVSLSGHRSDRALFPCSRRKCQSFGIKKSCKRAKPGMIMISSRRFLVGNLNGLVTIYWNKPPTLYLHIAPSSIVPILMHGTYVCAVEDGEDE